MGGCHPATNECRNGDTLLEEEKTGSPLFTFLLRLLEYHCDDSLAGPLGPRRALCGAPVAVWSMQRCAIALNEAAADEKSHRTRRCAVASTRMIERREC